MKYKNKYKVWDHKTTSTGWWKLAGVMMDQQNPLYAAILREQGFEISHTTMNMLNTYPYKKLNEVPIEKLFNRIEVERTSTELDRAVIQFGKLVDRLLDNYTDPRKSLKKACEDCQYQQPCHLGQIGMNQKPVLLNNYKKKVGTFDASE
jgi:CRISPR/Cas system-associated exonuclease Cas4 (RecB family)